MKHRTILALLLALCLLLGSLPASATIPCPPHSFGPWRVEEAPTCTTPGRESRQCQYCYETETRYPAALGHNFQFVVRDQPSCTKQGYGIDMCTRCGATRDNGRPIDALGHNYQRTVAQEPTCTSAGTAVYTCSRCGDAYREPIPASNHKWGPWQPGDPATCVQHGTRYHDCTRCGAREWERDYTTGLGDHDWGEWVTVKEPTATEPGLQERTCKVDASHKEQQEIPATGEVNPAEPDNKEPKAELTLSVQMRDPQESYPYATTVSESAETWYDYTITNTGDIPLYVRLTRMKGTSSSDAYGGHVLQPGESYSGYGKCIMICYSNTMTPDPDDSPYMGTIRQKFTATGYDITNKDLKLCESNTVIIDAKIAKKSEPDKPGIKILVTQFNPEVEKEAYKEGDPFGYDIEVTNTGNVPLLFDPYCKFGTYSDINLSAYKDRILDPGESWYFAGEPFSINLSVSYKYMIPDPEDSPYAGSFPISFRVEGFALDDKDHTTPICDDGPVIFDHKVAKPGPATWEIPEESQLKVEPYFAPSSFRPSDPAGYQLGEPWNVSIPIYNVGSVLIDECILRVDYTGQHIDDEWHSWHNVTAYGSNWYEAECKNIIEGGGPSGGGRSIIQPEDVDRGYIQVTATVKWIDPDSGNERTATGTCSMPVISKTGLVLNKGYKDPANGEYFEEGEQIEWTLSMKNNSKEPIKDITVTDNGATIGMFAEVTPEQGEIKLGVPKYTVTEYDAKVIGKVTNIANATGTDLKGVEHTYPSNPAVAKAGNKAPDPNDGDGGGGTDPLGPIYGHDIAVSIIKAEAHGPAQEDWYALNENVDYTVTVKNTGKDPIENVTVYDSLNGFTPIGTVSSLAPGEEKTFSFTWKVTPYNVDVMHYVVNQATVTYTFGGGINGTPMKSNKVYVKAGENGFIPTDGFIDPDGDPDGHFDPGILHGEGDDCCTMTLFYTGENEAYYQLTRCGEHAKVIADAKAAADAGDWATIVQTIREALDAIYTKYYEAGDDSAKAAVMNERLTYYAHIGAYQTLAGDQAAAEKMALKLIQLCSMANTAPETLPDSLLNAMDNIKAGNTNADATGRVIGLFEGENEVTDTYAGADARALKGVKDLLFDAKSYNYDEVFERGQIIWQVALDESVNAIYKAADRETRKQIAAWRISLDNLYTGERPMLEMLYPDNDAVVEEILMNLYRDTALDKEKVR